GSRLTSAVPNNRSNAARGFTSGGIEVVGVRQERLFVYAQLKPESQFPTLREASQPSSIEGNRVCEPTFCAAAWSAETPAWSSELGVVVQWTPERNEAPARAWSPAPSPSAFPL